MARTDSELAERVREALRSDSRTQNGAIEVTARGGLVTLKGTAPTAEIVDAAEVLATSQHGVTEVVNDLVVEPGEEPDQQGPPFPPVRSGSL
ncbi:MAG: BON domain-containing protein [Anaerolineales bacterium]